MGIGGRGHHVKTPGSGRKKGTPNKATQDLHLICEEEGIDPFRALAKLANPDVEGLTLEQKLAAYGMQFAALKELCQYLYPKRKALEHSGEVNNPYADKTYEELKELVVTKIAGD